MKGKYLYSWRPDCSILSHSHSRLPPPITFGGRTNVIYEQHRSSKEKNFIEEQSLSRIGIPQMQVNLEREYPFHSFNYKLICCLQNKVLDDRFGFDRTQLHALVKKGDDVKRHGGMFGIDPSPDNFGIDAIHFQLRLFCAHANTYGTNDFKMADGTHHLSHRNSIAAFWIVIDCLIHTKFADCTFAFTENSVPIIRGAQMFFPGEDVGNASRMTVDVCELAGFFDPLIDSSVDINVLDFKE